VAVLALHALMLVSVAGTEPGARPHFLRPDEMYKRMEASPVKYDVHPLTDLKDVPLGHLAEALWPERSPRIELPTVSVSADGHREIVPYEIDPKSGALLDEAEEDFQAKRYPKAEERYRKALEISPRNYVAWSHLGDSALNQGKAEEALRDYDKAIALNPYDYRPWFYKGDALAQLKRRSEELDAYATSLVLRPRSPILIQKLRHAGLAANDDFIQPRGFARREVDGVGIYGDGATWLAFAMCKGLWIGEPSHRQEMLGEGVSWSSREETECLASLIAVYETSRSNKDFKADPNLEQLSRIALKDRMLEDLALYELGSRLDPHVTLRLNDQQRAQLKKYVLKYVLTVR
jgi:tetratricopeptide (TPR) repeat protein